MDGGFYIPKYTNPRSDDKSSSRSSSKSSSSSSRRRSKKNQLYMPSYDEYSKLQGDSEPVEEPPTVAETPPPEPKKEPGFWERLGGYTKEYAEGVGNILAEAARAPIRGVKTLGLELRGEKEYVPKSELEKFIYGDEPVKNLTGAGRDLYSLGATVATGGRDRDAGERLDPLAATLLGTGATALDLLPGALTTAGTKAGVKTASKRAAEQVREQEFKRMQADMPEFAPSDLEGFIPRKIKVKEQSSAPSIGNAKTVDAQEYDKRFTKLSRAYDRELKAVEGLPEPRRTVTANAVEAKYAQAVDELDRNFGATKVGFKGGRTRSAALEAERPRPTTLTLGSLASRKVAPRTDLPVGQEEYGFMETLRTSERTTPELKAKLEKSAGYTPQPNDPLIKDATQLVRDDINKAEQVAKESSNKGVATATALIEHYQKVGNFERAGEIAEAAAERLTEAGRQIQAASIWNRLGPDGIVQYASRQLRKEGKKLDPQLRTDLQKMATDLKKIEDPEARAIATKQMMDEIGRAKGSTLGEKVAAAWKAGLLTSPLTTAGNIIGNVQEAAVRKALVDPIAAAADKVMSAATGRRTKTMTMSGLFSGGREGSLRGVKYFKTGYDPRHDPLRKFDAKDVYFSDTPLGRAAEKYTQGVFRLMGAVDQPFYYGALRNSLADQARAAAKTQGLKGVERSDFIKKFVTEPTEQAMKLADEEAQFATFQNKTRLGAAAGRAKSALGPGGEVAMPFTQVPSSIATRVITRTPIGTAREIVRQIQNVRKGKGFDQRAMAQAIGEGGAGLALIGAGAALIKAGDINLGYPSDPKERELWEQEGRQPYSIKIGDKWHSLNYLQPFGAIIAMGAAYERAKKEGLDNATAVIQGAAEAGRAMVEQSFLKGLSGGIKALNEPEREAESFIKNLSNSLMPNIIDAFARAFDEDQRVVEGALDAFKSTIPGLRETLPAKTDVTGETMKNEAGLGALINPLRSSDAKTTPLTQELRTLQDLKLGVMPTEATKKTFKVRDLTSSEIRDLTNSSAKRTSDVWNRIIKSSGYRSLTPEQKRKALDKARDDVWAVEKYRFGKEHGLNDDKSWRNLSRAQRSLYRTGAYQDYIEKAQD